MATSRLSIAEISSALARRLHDGELSCARYDDALAHLAEDMARFTLVEVAPPVVEAVHALLLRHRLRALDALHLSSALSLRAHASLSIEFVCYDLRLRAAAAAEGLRVHPASL